MVLEHNIRTMNKINRNQYCNYTIWIQHPHCKQVHTPNDTNKKNTIETTKKYSIATIAVLYENFFIKVLQNNTW